MEHKNPDPGRLLTVLVKLGVIESKLKYHIELTRFDKVFQDWKLKEEDLDRIRNYNG